MTVYVENFKRIYKKITRISELKKIIGYKINVQNSIVFHVLAVNNWKLKI